MYRFGSRVAPEEEIPMKPTQMGLWALILAGDATKRLLPLTSRLGGAPDRAPRVVVRAWVACGRAGSVAVAVLVLVLAATEARAQHLEGPPTELLRVEWTGEVSKALGPMVTGYVYNYRITSVRHVQLRIDVHDGSGRMVADVYRFVNGDISPGGRTYFVSPVPVVGAEYRVTVQSFEVLGGGP